MLKKVALLSLLAFTAACPQSQVPGDRYFKGLVDVSQATAVRPFREVIVLPATCSTSPTDYVQLTQSGEKKVYYCSASNTWSQLSAQGTKGDKGDKGDQGAPGADGGGASNVSPYAITLSNANNLSENASISLFDTRSGGNRYQLFSGSPEPGWMVFYSVTSDNTAFGIKAAENKYNIAGTFQLGFTNGKYANGVADVGLYRSTAGKIKVTNGSTGNGNFEAGRADFTSLYVNGTQITSGGGGGGGTSTPATATALGLVKVPANSGLSVDSEGALSVVGGGGGGGTSNNCFAAATASNTITITGGTSGSPCIWRFGSQTQSLNNAGSTLTWTQGAAPNSTTTWYVYVSPDGTNRIHVGSNLNGASGAVTSSNSTVVYDSGVIAFPINSMPLYACSMTSGTFDTNGCVDYRASQVGMPIVAGAGMSVSDTGSTKTIGVDKTAVMTLVAVPGTSSTACSANSYAYDNNYMYFCVATNTWRRSALSTF